MTAQTAKSSGASRPSRASKKSRKASDWTRWWPVLLGMAVTPLAVKTAEILPLTGGGGLEKLRLLYPFAMLIREHALGISDAQRELASHIMLYAQFPLYGLYVTITMKWKSWIGAFVQIFGIHLACFLVLWFFARK